MNRINFNKLFDEMIEREKSLLDYKRGEYAKNSSDVLVNFKQNANFLGMSPEDVCLTYLMKHVQSISGTVRNQTKGADKIKFEWETPEGKEGLVQRFADARNYLILLAALIKEKEDAGSAEIASDEG